MIHLQKVTAEADLAVCLMIRRRVFIDEQGIAEALEMDEYDEAGGLKNCPHYLALSDGVPVATCRCLRKDGGAVKLQRFCVLPEWRGSGVGRELLTMLEKDCREQGVTRMEMGAQCHAVPFYQKCGYTVTSGQFMDAGIPHVKMEKNFAYDKNTVERK